MFNGILGTIGLCILGIIAIPVALVIAFNAIKFIFEMIGCIGNFIWAFVLVGIITLLVLFIL